MDRRDALRVVGGVSIAGLAGCSMLGGDSDDDGDIPRGTDSNTPGDTETDTLTETEIDTPTEAKTDTPADTETDTPTDTPTETETVTDGNPDGESVVRESFESASLIQTVTTNTSQSEGNVFLKADHSSEGSQSLGMSSKPGTNTSAKVRTTEVFAGSRRYAVDLYKVADDVSEGGCRLTLLDTNSDAELMLFDIDYYDGVCYEERDENGDRITRSSVTGPLSTGAWHELSISVFEDSVSFETGTEKSTYEPALSWTDRDVVVRLQTNVWGGAFGTNLDVRYDNLRVSEL